MQYSKAKTIIKAVLHFCGAMAAALSAVWVVLPADAPVSLADWKVAIVPLALAAWRGIENYRKNSGENGKPAWEWANLLPFCLVVCAALLVTGCVTTKFHNEYQTTDGKVSVTDYKGVSMAWPLGKLDTTAHKLETQYGANSHVALGQDASGMDNTGQAALIQMIIEAAIKSAATAATVSP